MNLLFLIRSLEVGGAERQLVELATGLSQRGHQVQVAVFYPTGPFMAILQARGIPVVSLDKRSRWDVFGPLRQLARVVTTGNVQAVFGFMPVENVLSLSTRLLRRRPALVWRLSTSNFNCGHYERMVAFTYRLQRLLMRWADRVVTNSMAALQEHGLSGDRRAVLIPNGIDTEELRPDAEAGHRWRAQQGIDAMATVIAMVGRMDPIKRIDLFLRAAAAARDAGARAVFMVIGPHAQDYVDALQASADAQRLGAQLQWRGTQSDRRALYNALDCVVNCSDSEGLSNVLAEAMACGTPVIATDVGHSRQLAGAHGTIIPPDDAAALQAAIERAGPEGAAGREARHRYIAGNYGLARLLDETERVLNGAVGGA